MGADMAIDTGIFDYGNVNFLADLPGGLGPQQIKAKGNVSWLNMIWKNIQHQKRFLPNMGLGGNHRIMEWTMFDT